MMEGRGEGDLSLDNVGREDLLQLGGSDRERGPLVTLARSQISTLSTENLSGWTTQTTEAWC